MASPSFAQVNVLYNFAVGTSGSTPMGDLFSDGTFLYGMTSNGGSNGGGTLFKIKTNGTGYSILHGFGSSTDGSKPQGAVISDGTYLYGMTTEGGSIACPNGCGTVFKIMTNGTGYVKLNDFSTNANVKFPYGSLIYDGTYLYGMPTGDISNSDGSIFKIKPDGTSYSRFFSFGGIANDGKNPHGTLISDGTYFYGTTLNGGLNSQGTIFQIMPDGTWYLDLFDFSGAGDGSSPNGSLFYDGTYLYGTTTNGGTNGGGVIFRILPNGTGFTALHNFASGTDGSNPRGSLISDGTYLYGMTEGGGTNSVGTIFKIKPNGTSYTKLIDFNTTNGAHPFGSLILNGTFLYGMTELGGTHNVGVIFKYCITPVTFTQTLTNCAGHSVIVGTHTYAATGTYTDLLTSFQGCDSTVTTHLIVLPANTFSQSPIVCAGHSITVGSHTYTTSATYTDVFTSLVNGCDSTVTTNLTVLPANTLTQSPSVCAGHSITVGSHTYSTSATYTDVFTSLVNGCDSTVTTHLTVLPANTFSQTKTVCAGHSVTIGSNIHSTNGTYTDLLTSYHGCDSTVTTNLTVLLANTFSQTQIECAGHSVTVGSTTHTATGTFIDVLTSLISGCDSTVTTNLTILPANTFSQSPTVCAGQSVTVGSHTYNTNGTYTDVLTSLVNGCDSVVTTYLTVNSIDTSVSVTNATLTASALSSTYQWINCSGNTTIIGATNQNYTATANGSYAVIITKNSCSDTSTCHSITTTGIVENSFATGITIFPNPFTSQTTITFNKEQKNISIKIMDELGKEVKAITFTGKQLVIEKGEMKAGVYFMQMQSEQGTLSKKLIINQ